MRISSKKTMPQMRVESAWLSALLLVGLLPLDAPVLATTLSELRQLVMDSTPLVRSARLTYTEKYDDYRASSARPPRPRSSPELEKIRRHTFGRIVSAIDLESGYENVVRTDLRDIDKLLEDHGLPERQRMNIDMTQVEVRRENLQMTFCNQEKSKPGPHIILSRLRANTERESRHLKAGVVPVELLAAEWNPVIEEVRQGDRELVLTTLTKETNGNRYGIAMMCDPALGYRLTCSKTTVDGRLVAEMTTDDYRDVNGVPFPFKQGTRHYDRTGKKIAERTYTFSDVQFNVKFSDEQFQVSVPAGTKVYDGVMQGVYTLDRAQVLSLEDVLGAKSREDAMRLAREAITPAPQPPPRQTPGQETVLPDASKAYPKGVPFVYDLQHMAFVQTPGQTELHTEAMHVFLDENEEGDIAWDGCFVPLRGASIRIRQRDKRKISNVRDELWDISIELKEECDLPLGLLVVTRKQTHFLVSINEITPDGIRVLTREITADEADDYGYALAPSQDD